MDQRKLMDNANTITDMAKVNNNRSRGKNLRIFHIDILNTSEN